MGDIETQQLAWVQRVLGCTLLQPPVEQRSEGPGIRLAKGLMIWNSTRSYVANRVADLQTAILLESQDEPDYPEIVDNIGKLDAVLEGLDDSLSEALGELQAASDPDKKASLSETARQIVLRFQKFSATDALINDIDDNGFLPLDIKPRIDQALATVLTTI